MSDVSMRRLTDSPTDQDVGGLGKIGQKICDICGGPGAGNWLHCDSWTKWMRFGCGCNVIHCDKPECKAGAEVRKKELKAINRAKAEEAEREMLKNISNGSLARLRFRYYDSFNCDIRFREWVASIVGTDRMCEMLDVACACCGRLLGQPRYTFQDQNGVRSLKTIDEIEDHCYAVMGRNKETSPFKTELGSLKADFHCGGMKKAEISFESPRFHYFVLKGWDTTNMLADDAKWREAGEATRGRDCGEKYDYEWSYGYFIYHLPTLTFLGQLMKRDGDWPQVVQSNYKQLEEEQVALREKYGENYAKNEEFWPAYRAIQQKQQWAYFCGKDCCAKSTDQHGTLFI